MTARLGRIACCALVMGGCALPSWVRPGVPAPGGGSLMMKVVVAKEEPATLIADDGTVCRAGGIRFESAEVGERVLCTWRADVY